MSTGSILQLDQPGSVFTVTSEDDAFVGQGNAFLMTQDQDGFNTIEKTLTFTVANNASTATLTLSVEDKSSLFNSTSVQTDKISMTINADGTNAVLFNGEINPISTYVLPGKPDYGSNYSPDNGVLKAELIFTSAPGAGGAIDKLRLVRSKGYALNTGDNNNSNGLEMFTYVLGAAANANGSFSVVSGNQYKLEILGLNNNWGYEASVQTGSDIGFSAISDTVELYPTEIMANPTLSVQTLNATNNGAATSTSFSTDKVQLTTNWHDIDAAQLHNLVTGTVLLGNSYATVKFYKDGSTSATAAYSRVLTNAECTTAAAVGGFTFAQNVDAGAYTARIVSTAPASASPLDALGAMSDSITAYQQGTPTLTSLLAATVTMSAGTQTFTATHTIPGVSGLATMAFTYDGNALSSAVTTAATSVSSSITYAQAAAAKIVVGTLSVVDKNTDTITYTYTSNNYTTAPFMTAAAPTGLSCETLLANGTPAASGASPALHADDAQLTVKWQDANAAQFRSSAVDGDDSKAKMEFYKDGTYVPAEDITLTNGQCTSATTGLVTFTQQVTGAGTYTARIYSTQAAQPSSFDANGTLSAGQAVNIQTAPAFTGPLTAAVAVNYNQTFTATYTVATTAGTQSLTIVDGVTNIFTSTVVTANGSKTSSAITSGAAASGSIIATLSVVDANTAGITYTYASATFTTVPIAAPGAPVANFLQNTTANNDTFTSQLSNLGAQNNYGDATNMTWQISTTNAAAGLLADVSGVYNPINTTNVQDITSGDDYTFVVNTAYWINVVKTNVFSALTTAGSLYPVDSLHADIRTVNTPIAAYAGGAGVKYMGNPTITSLTLTAGTADTAGNRGSATVVVNRNQSVLETSNALTLMMMTNIAADGDVVVGAEVALCDSPPSVVQANLGYTLVNSGQTATFTIPAKPGHVLNGTSFAFASVNAINSHTAHQGINIPTAATPLYAEGTAPNSSML